MQASLTFAADLSPSIRLDVGEDRSIQSIEMMKTHEAHCDFARSGCFYVFVVN